MMDIDVWYTTITTISMTLSLENHYHSNVGSIIRAAGWRDIDKVYSADEHFIYINHLDM